ncbi:MAG: 2-phosphosulfolactate phosphatase [Ferruginibacter sp.]|nr:2-phosphosulfolactate phosphatase [Ferruginibacter sp.]
MNDKQLPELYTCISPALLHLYDVSKSIVVIIDVLRATSTIAAAMHNGAKNIVPVASVAECIRIGKQIDAITAGERDGRVAEGLQYGNSPFEYPRTFIENKTLVLTTTNGTRLLHMALEKGAKEIITGAFSNLEAVCHYIIQKKMPVVLACAAWKDKLNIEDTLFAGAVINRVREHFSIRCDASAMASNMYTLAEPNLYEFMKENNASHYLRLTGFGLEKDIRHCLTANTAPVLPVYQHGSLVKSHI